MLFFKFNKKTSKYFYSYCYVIIVHSLYVWLTVWHLVWIAGYYTAVMNG